MNMYICENIKRLRKEKNITQEKQNYAEFWGDMGEYNSMLKRQLAWYENNPWFEELRKLDSFNAMLEKYGYYVKDSKK